MSAADVAARPSRTRRTGATRTARARRRRPSLKSMPPEKSQFEAAVGPGVDAAVLSVSVSYAMPSAHPRREPLLRGEAERAERRRCAARPRSSSDAAVGDVARERHRAQPRKPYSRRPREAPAESIRGSRYIASSWIGICQLRRVRQLASAAASPIADREAAADAEGGTGAREAAGSEDDDRGLRAGAPCAFWTSSRERVRAWTYAHREMLQRARDARERACERASRGLHSS